MGHDPRESGGDVKKPGRKKAAAGEKRVSRSINLKPRHWRALEKLGKAVGGTCSRWVETKIVETGEKP